MHPTILDAEAASRHRIPGTPPGTGKRGDGENVATGKVRRRRKRGDGESPEPEIMQACLIVPAPAATLDAMPPQQGE
ncbi:MULTISPECIES: hypothetical protein [unclassified Streptomyces]|uniref:hypothetical protein n=1 Tax=unclassified Streptomyces TaxID=2593676 RepID=UPI0011E89A7D|nr:hypothetical protein [Streptomyces sp. sk2.1]